MYWLGLLLVSPLWAMLSTQFFLQGWLSLIDFAIALIGFYRRNVSTAILVAAVIAALWGFLLAIVLLSGGFYLLHVRMSFLSTRSETIMYSVFVVFSIFYMAAEFVYKIKKHWRNCLIPGSLELDIAQRKTRQP